MNINCEKGKYLDQGRITGELERASLEHYYTFSEEIDPNSSFQIIQLQYQWQNCFYALLNVHYDDDDDDDDDDGTWVSFETCVQLDLC